MKHNIQIAIIGGGITGLSAAYRLQTRLPGATITLIERDTRLGGKLRTDEVDGFAIEGGADSFLLRKPRGVGLCRELGIEAVLYGRDPRHSKTFVRHQEQLHPLPEGLSGFVPTKLEALEHSALLSAAGKVRLAQESHIPAQPGNGDESVAAFITRRMGQEAYAHLIEPLMSGIYAGDGTQLSLAATYPQLRHLEQTHGSLMKGLMATPPAATNHPPFVTLPCGMGELVTTLVKRLSHVQILTGIGVVQLEANATGYRLILDDTAATTITADAVIFATPAYVTAQLVSTLNPALAQAHSAIPYASAVTISFAYRTADLPQPPEGYGYVIPRTEGTDVLACTWSSNKWNGRAPADSILLRVYLGRYGRHDMTTLDNEQLLQLARAELAKTLNLQAEPLFHHLYRWPLAMPQYTLGHLERVAAIEAQLHHHPGLFVAGAAYRGVGIPDCIQSGEAAAENAMAYLKVGSRQK